MNGIFTLMHIQTHSDIHANFENAYLLVCISEFAYFSKFELIMQTFCIFLISIFVHIPAYLVLHIAAYFMHISAYFNLHIRALPSCIFKYITHISAYNCISMHIFGLLCTYIAYFSFAYLCKFLANLVLHIL